MRSSYTKTFRMMNMTYNNDIIKPCSSHRSNFLTWCQMVFQFQRFQMSIFCDDIIVLFQEDDYFSISSIGWSRILGSFHFNSGETISRCNEIVGYTNNSICIGMNLKKKFSARAIALMKWHIFVMLKDPMMNINTGAVALTGAVLLGGFLTTYLWKSAMKDQVHFVNGPSYYPYGRKNGLYSNTKCCYDC